MNLKNNLFNFRLFCIGVCRMIKYRNFILISFNDEGEYCTVYKTKYTSRVERVILKNVLDTTYPVSDESDLLDFFKENENYE